MTKGVDPTLCCYYRSSRLKQYFKEGKALRTETVICDTKDFGIGRLVCSKNWSALREVGESANRVCVMPKLQMLNPPRMWPPLRR